MNTHNKLPIFLIFKKSKINLNMKKSKNNKIHNIPNRTGTVFKKGKEEKSTRKISVHYIPEHSSRLPANVTIFIFILQILQRTLLPFLTHL